MNIIKLDFDTQFQILKNLKLKDIIKLESSNKEVKKILKNISPYLIFKKIAFKNFEQLDFIIKYKIKVLNLHLPYNIACNYNSQGVFWGFKDYDFFQKLYNIIDDLNIENFIFNMIGKYFYDFDISTNKLKLQKLKKEEIIVILKYDEKLNLNNKNVMINILNFNFEHYLKMIEILSFNNFIVNIDPSEINKKYFYNLNFNISSSIYENKSESEKLHLIYLLNFKNIKIRTLEIDQAFFNLINDYTLFRNKFLKTIILKDIHLDQIYIENIFSQNIKELYLLDITGDYKKILKYIALKSENIEYLNLSVNTISLDSLKSLKYFKNIKSLKLHFNGRNDYIYIIKELLKYLKSKNIILEKIVLSADEFLNPEVYLIKGIDKYGEDEPDNDEYKILKEQYKKIPEYLILKEYVENIFFEFLDNPNSRKILETGLMT